MELVDFVMCCTMISLMKMSVGLFSWTNQIPQTKLYQSSTQSRGCRAVCTNTKNPQIDTHTTSSSSLLVAPWGEKLSRGYNLKFCWYFPSISLFSIKSFLLQLYIMCPRPEIFDLLLSEKIPGGAWLAQLEEYITLDLGVMSLRSMLGIEIT